MKIHICQLSDLEIGMNIPKMRFHKMDKQEELLLGIFFLHVVDFQDWQTMARCMGKMVLVFLTYHTEIIREHEKDLPQNWIQSLLPSADSLSIFILCAPMSIKLPVLIPAILLLGRAVFTHNTELNDQYSYGECQLVQMNPVFPDAQTQRPANSGCDSSYQDTYFTTYPQAHTQEEDCLSPVDAMKTGTPVLCEHYSNCSYPQPCPQCNNFGNKHHEDVLFQKSSNAVSDDGECTAVNHCIQPTYQENHQGFGVHEDRAGGSYKTDIHSDIRNECGLSSDSVDPLQTAEFDLSTSKYMSHSTNISAGVCRVQKGAESWGRRMLLAFNVKK